MDKKETDGQAFKKQAFSLIIVILLTWAVVALMVILFAPIISLAEAQLYDRLFLLRNLIKGKEEASPYIIHALIDDKSLLQTDELTADRDIIARLVAILQDQGAGQIGLDILYQHARPEKEDSTLIEMVQKAGNVFLPVVLYNRHSDARGKKPIVFDFLKTNQNTTRKASLSEVILTPFPALAGAAHGFGHVNCDPDRDGINRSFHLIACYGNYYIPSLPLRIICSYLRVDSDNVILSPGKHLLLKNATLPGNRIRDIAIPVDNKGRIRINYIGPWKDSFYALSVFDIIEAQKNSVLRVQLRDILKDAIVLISDVSVQNKDNGPGVFDKLTPNSEILLTIMNMILTRQFITPLDPILCLLLFTLFSILIYFSAYITSTPLEFIAYTGCFILYMATCISLFILSRTILPILIPALGFFLYMLFMGIYHYSLQKKRALHFASAVRTEQAEKECLIEEVSSVTIEKEGLKRREQSIKHLMGQVMHDLRNLLQSVTHPLTQHKVQPKKRKSKIPASASSAITIKKIIEIAEDLLVLVQKEEGHLRLQARKNNLSVLAVECYETFRSEAKKKGIDYCYVPSKSPVTLFCDHIKVSRIIINLLSNALKFTRSGGTVTLTVQAPELYDESLYDWKWPRTKPKQIAVIQVEDTGCGIPQSDTTAIFAQFTRVQNKEMHNKEGFGLGLAIAADFAELHYGHIALKSKEGKGSVFILYLPLGNAHLADDEIKQEEEPAPCDISPAGNEEISNEFTAMSQAGNKENNKEFTAISRVSYLEEKTQESGTGLYRVENENESGIRMFGFGEPFKGQPGLFIVQVKERGNLFLSTLQGSTGNL